MLTASMAMAGLGTNTKFVVVEWTSRYILAHLLKRLCCLGWVKLCVHQTLTTVSDCRCRTWSWLDRMTTCLPVRLCCCGVDGQWMVTRGCTSRTSQRPGEMERPSLPFCTDTGESVNRDLRVNLMLPFRHS